MIAVVANGFAGRTRRLVLPGYYPNALRVPPVVPERVPPPPIRDPEALAQTATTTAATVTAPATTTTPLVPTTTAPTTTAPATPTTTTAPPTAAAAVKPATPTPKPAASLDRFQPHPDQAYVEISGEDAAALHRHGALFLDARRSSVYEEGHIAGARSFSVWEADVDDKVNKLFEERQDPVEQNKPVVIYCTGGACEDSHMLAQKLWGVQFNNLYVYKDGFPDWQQRNGAVRTGATP